MSREEPPGPAAEPPGPAWADGFLATVIRDQLRNEASDDDEEASRSSASVTSVSTLVIDHRTLAALHQASPGVRARFLAALRGCTGVVKVRLDLEPSDAAAAPDFPRADDDAFLLLCDRLGAALGGMPECEALEVALGGNDDARCRLAAAARILRGARQIGTLHWTQRRSAAAAVDEAAAEALLADALTHHDRLGRARLEVPSAADLRGVCAMLARCPHLSEVEVGSSRWEGLRGAGGAAAQGGVEALARVLRMESLSEVRFRSIEWAMDGDVAGGLWDALAEATLSRLAFHRASLDVAHQRALGRALSRSTITTLTMDDTILSSDFFVEMTDEMAGDSALECIDLSGCALQDHTTRGIESFLAHVSRFPKLKVVRLPSCPWSRALDEALGDSLRRSSTIQELQVAGQATPREANPFACIAGALKCTSSLESLYLDVARVGASHYAAVGVALSYNTSVQILTLRWRVWSLKGFATFLHQIRHNRTLEGLTIEVDSFMVRGLHQATFQDSVLDVARRNFHLKSLRIVGGGGSMYGPFEWELNQNLQTVTRLNGAGRRYLLTESTSKEKSAAVLAVVRDDLNCLYMHLRENPHVCKPDAVSRSDLRLGHGWSESSLISKWKLGCIVALLCIGSGFQRLTVMN